MEAELRWKGRETVLSREKQQRTVLGGSPAGPVSEAGICAALSLPDPHSRNKAT